MGDFTNEQVDAVWSKGRTIPGYDGAKYRLDAAGAMMIRDRYGKEGMYGWEVDHIFPKAELEKQKVKEELWDDFQNLRPMNAKNNASKGDEYPKYKASYEYDDQERVNKEVEATKMIDEGVQTALATLFGLNKIQT